MKLAWIIQGEPSTAWSYFIQIKLFSKYLDRLGHHSHIINYTSLDDDFPAISQAVINIHPHILLNIGDVHILNLAQEFHLPVISIVTNGTGRIPIKASVKNTTFACTSKFALTLLRSAGISPTPYFPHGFDPEIFLPGHRSAARRRLGWTHTTPTVLMLGTNYPIDPKDPHLDPKIDRKNFFGGLQAFSLLRQKRPHVKLYLHTNTYGAVDLMQEISRLKLDQAVILADTTSKPGIINTQINTQPQSHLADVYRASDLLLFPSLGESFGVPLIEAQACGIPVIATDTGPMAELVITGTKVTASPHPAHSAWGIPNTKRLATALAKWIDTHDSINISRKVAPFSAPRIIQHYLLDIITAAGQNYRS